MVTRLKRLVEPAVDVGDRVVERRSPRGRRVPRDLVELARSGHRHESAEVELVVGEDVDTEEGDSFISA